ncbi:MAG: queuosine precursor transporter [Bacteroidetes bacterium]|nr:queuosine precursor transporter [Bacteroidota bacterium]
MFKTKKDIVYLILAGIFITNAVVAELIGAKLIQIGPFTMSIGIIPWPVVFLTTDLINEYYGKKGVRTLSLITAGLIAYAFVVLFFAININASSVSLVTNEQFTAVFGQSMWIIVGSIVAFLVGQMIDVFIFWTLRNKTGGKLIWLRTTGSTAVSQFIDTFLVVGIAFWLPGKMTTEVFINVALTGYTFKLLVAIGLTPLIYAGHALIDKYFGQEAQIVLKETAEEVLHHKVKE